MAKILVADDEHAICSAFQSIAAKAGHDCVTASTGQEAISAAQQHRPDVTFLDVRLPDMSGLDVLERFQHNHKDMPVVVMTAHGTVQTAMQAIRGGAFDYLGKPLELTQIRTLLDRALQQRQTASDSDLVSVDSDGEEQLIGSSAVMQEIYKMMSLLAGNDLTVLITGESGVGKEMVARGIHQHSARNEEPFVAVNCAAIPEQLIESELFGHEKGAFSSAHTRRAGRFEAAAGGTLFLDEVFELPMHLQSKLLRALQERSFERVGSVTPIELEARIIAATNRPIQNVGVTIREDLYHRLSLINLNIPALRDRREDIPALAHHFLAQANLALDKDIKGIHEEALAQLQGYTWPGNVRELDHTIKRSALTASGPMLNSMDLQFESTPVSAAADAVDPIELTAKTALQEILARPPPSDDETSAFHSLVAQTEAAIIEEALHITEGNQVAAAQLLGINRTTLRNKMKRE